MKVIKDERPPCWWLPEQKENITILAQNVMEDLDQ